MLSVLRIENLALVDSLTWELSAGLTAVTGETGAGKSIIVGALKLLLGDRGDRSLVRSGKDSCTVEGMFDLEDVDTVNALLSDAGVPPCEGGQLVVRRVVAAEGANRQFVNCAPATLALLRSLGPHLVDLHGPHAHQSLLSRERQLQMLDAFAATRSERRTYRKAYQEWMAREAELADLDDGGASTGQQLDLLRHQLREIEQADVRPEDEPELLRQFQMVSNATALIETLERLQSLLTDGAEPILDQLRAVQRLGRDLEELDPGVRSWSQGLDTALVELEEFSQSAGRYADHLDPDPARHRELEARIDVLESLKRKYGGTLEAVVAHGQAVSARLRAAENRDESLAELRRRRDAACRKALRLGARLSRLRREAAPRLAQAVVEHLEALGFRQSRVEVDLPPAPEPGPEGLETAEIIFAPNPGEPPQALRQIASSGEMSRVMLAVKSALAGEDQTPLLVFDEIDANVGGEIAGSVGRKMSQLGRSHQVIAITHLPQVAALASSHFLVEKDVLGGRTVSGIREVRDAERVAEIARMLGGRSDSALAHAANLLRQIAVHPKRTARI